MKTRQSLPATGVIEVIAIRYAEVNQLVLAKASRSLAIGDCIVVSKDMFEVKTNTSVNSEVMIRMPRVLDTRIDCVSSASVKVLDESEAGSSNGDRSEGVTVSDSIKA